MKKLLALICSLVIIVSLFASTVVVSAAVDGLSVTLEDSIENISGYDYIKVDVKVTIPQTLVDYSTVSAGVPIPTTTYSGTMLQSVGIDIPVPAGLTWIPSMSKNTAEYITVQDKVSSSGMVTLYYLASGAWNTYYAGDIDLLVTLYYYTADLEQTYNLSVSDATLAIVDFADETSSTPTPIGYVMSDFNITNAVIEPEEDEPEYEFVDTKIADLVADTTPLVAEDGTTKFTNVAKYTGSFNLTDITDGLDIAGGEELIKVGFKKNGEADTFTSISVSGPGTVKYSFLFYGIADASVLDIDTYYTAKKIVVE